MTRAVRIFVLMSILAALPLRGFAGVLMSLCESHHGGSDVVQVHAHEGGEQNHEHSDHGSGSSTLSASVCSLCASCCASVGLASGSNGPIAFLAPDSGPIPFLSRQVSGFVPDQLDRPPLSL